MVTSLIQMRFDVVTSEDRFPCCYSNIKDTHVHVLRCTGICLFCVGGYLLSKPFPKRQILDSSKLKEFADDNFKFDENGRKCSKWVENTVGKGEIICYKQFLHLPQ